MAKAKRPGLLVDVDMEEGYAANGYMYGFSKEVSTAYYMDDVITFTHSMMAQSFDQHMLGLAEANPANYHHLYEPGHIADPGFELWRHEIFNKGKKREATWEWLPSKLPILKPMERKQQNKWDVMRKVPTDVIQDKLEQSNNNDYIFVWRAPIMEYRMRVQIEPKNTKMLFIPLKNATGLRGSKQNKLGKQNFTFAFENMPDWDYANPQDASGTVGGNGKGGTVNRFTSAWVAFWNGGMADEVWESRVEPFISRGIREVEADMTMRTKTRRRVGTVSFATFNSQKAAFEKGANHARAFVRGQAASYRKAARYIEKKGFFGGEREY